MTVETRNNEGRQRYELVVDGRVVGVADYDVNDDTVVFPHTVVEPALRGQGLAGQLVGSALDDVRETGRRVVPTCWYVRQFIDQHPEYQDLLAA